jgi:peptidoglycan/LPS O-acetylase OafA/YrhL
MNTYRADIDGLRALAVLLVLFYHVDITLFSGGFVGVDIFFTISGFLITNIVIKDLVKGNFSFVSFYIRRASRLLPAYISLLFFVMCFGCFILAPIAYQGLLESALSSLLFSSNFYFLFFHTGYFSTAVNELPLLHTWSLAVEEQFYLVMPLALVGWFKFSRNIYKLYAFAIVFFISILISYYLTSLHKSAAYYLVISRVHEFLIGSALAIYLHFNNTQQPPRLKTANILFTFSLMLVLLSSVYLNSQLEFPGILAILPCLATAGIIYSGTNLQCYSHKLLGFKPIVFIGLISYSLYLWHWPLVAFCKYIGLNFVPSVQFSIIIGSCVLGYLSWRYVEQTTRYALFAKSGKTATYFYLVPALVTGTLLILVNNNIVTFSKSVDVVIVEHATKSQPETGREHCHTADLPLSSQCQLGSNNVNAKKAVLWGDSHANHFTGFIDVLGKENDLGVNDFTMGNCPPILELYINVNSARQACISKNNAVLEYIQKHRPEVVFLAGSWEGYINSHALNGDSRQEKSDLLFLNLQKTVSLLAELKINVVIFEMLPKPPNDMSMCVLKSVAFPALNSLGSCTFQLSKNQIDTNHSLATITNNMMGSVQLLALISALCDNNICTTYIDDTPLYRDSSHLNLVGSRALAKYYLSQYSFSM